MRTQPPAPSSMPIWLNLRKFHFPLQAKLSIAHRITGILTILFLLSGLVVLNLWILQPSAFNAIVAFWQSLFGKCWLWLGLSALLFHWLAGIRHLMMVQNGASSAKGLLWLYLLLWLILTGMIWL